MGEIAGKAVIVTGASAGIGRATAVLLAEAGANLMVTARREERLNSLAAELAGLPGSVRVLAGDIGDETFAKMLVAETVHAFGQLDVLINNAGVGHKSKLADMPTEQIRRVFDTNLFGLMAAAQAAVSHMKQQGHGHIINVSSIVGQRPLPDSGVYCASKTAVNFLSRTLRMELRGTPIKVTVVYPGLTDTEFADAKLGDVGRNRFGLRGVPAEKVGKAILRGIENGRSEIYITPTDWAFTHLNRLFPRTIDWLLGKMGGLT